METKSAYEWLRGQLGAQFDSIKIQEGIPAALQKENHQGIAFKTNHPFYKTYDAQEMRKHRSIILCNHVEDVHNLGSITRCAAAFGSSLIIHEQDRSASVTAAVIKSSAGCAFRVSFMRVESLEVPLKTLKKSDYEIFGLDVSDQSQELYDAKLTHRAPRAFVFGSEGFGIEDVNKSYCKTMLKIPMASHVESLNVSHAAAVVLSWAYCLDKAGA